MMAHFVFTHFWLISSFMHQIKVINTMRLILKSQIIDTFSSVKFKLKHLHAMKCTGVFGGWGQGE